MDLQPSKVPNSKNVGWFNLSVVQNTTFIEPAEKNEYTCL